MLLIETRQNGKLIRQHWHAPCANLRQAARNTRFMRRCWGKEYQHTVREMTPEEIAGIVIPSAPTQKQKAEYTAEIATWQAECLRIGKGNV